MRKVFERWLAVDISPVSHKEKWVAAAGAFAGILTTAWVSSLFLSNGDTWLMVGSMGASAVLLFAVPHGQLSQPWAATGGQLISAYIGVSCAHWIHSPILASACAVSLAVLAMHYARCVHPPGGATALAAVIGGDSIHSLGYGFVYKPVLINSFTILVIAFAFNNLLLWRRYPATLQKQDSLTNDEMSVRREDIAYALKQVDTPIDVTEDELLGIVHTAEAHVRTRNENKQGN